jgi:hypothetical protein
MAPRPLIHIIMQPVDPLAARLTHPLDRASSHSPLVRVLSRNSHIVSICLSSLQPMSGGAAKRGPTTAVPEEVGMSSARLDQLERFQREMVDGERLPCTHLVVTRHGRTVYVFTLTPTMTTSALRKHLYCRGCSPLVDRRRLQPDASACNTRTCTRTRSPFVVHTLCTRARANTQYHILLT